MSWIDACPTLVNDPIRVSALHIDVQQDRFLSLESQSRPITPCQHSGQVTFHVTHENKLAQRLDSGLSLPVLCAEYGIISADNWTIPIVLQEAVSKPFLTTFNRSEYELGDARQPLAIHGFLLVALVFCDGQQKFVYSCNPPLCTPLLVALRECK